jgi:hypothetical protein
MHTTADFQSFFMAGFECACQRTFAGKRLNIAQTSGHTVSALDDYRLVQASGIGTVRDGLHWPEIEVVAGRYDFSSVLPMVRAAAMTGTQVVWDLCHFGWPDGLDIFSPAFVDRLAGLADAFARLLRQESDAAPVINPVNEISYFAWAGGEAGYFYPYERGRGKELKRQLVRSTIAAIEAVRHVCPDARFVSTDPSVLVHSRGDAVTDQESAAEATERQFEARDMLAGRLEACLGGDPKYLDILGVCYYEYNQWIHGETIADRVPLHRQDARTVPLHVILTGLYSRYDRPIFVAETSAEHGDRSDWLRNVCEQARAAITAGVPISGVCWYPIVNHPGWDDDRPCQHGLWDVVNAQGRRLVHQPLSDELSRQQALMRTLPSGVEQAARPIVVSGF